MTKKAFLIHRLVLTLKFMSLSQSEFELSPRLLASTAMHSYKSCCLTRIYIALAEIKVVRWIAIGLSSGEIKDQHLGTEAKEMQREKKVEKLPAVLSMDAAMLMLGSRTCLKIF